jgi:hypothetical protein
MVCTFPSEGMSAIGMYRPKWSQSLTALELDINPGKRNSVSFIRFEVFTVATMKNFVYWDVAPCNSV